MTSSDKQGFPAYNGRHLKHSRLVNIALAALSIIITLCGIEAAVRFQENRAPQAKSDRPAFYYKPPGNLGMMDREYSFAELPGAYRIVGIGDSITFGLHIQYDDVFLKRLERMLNLNDHGRRVDVINLAQPGLSTFQQINDLETAFTYNPDLIILGYCLNDPELKIQRNTDIIRQVGYGHFGKKVFHGWQKELAGIWHTYRFVSERIHNHLSRKDYIDYFHRLYRDDFKGWERSRSSLKQMARSCRKRHIRFVVVILPLVGAGTRRYPFTDIHEKLGNYLKRIGVPYLDLYPAFAGIASDRIEVAPGEDRHYSEIGHRIAAEGIYQFLIDNGHIPKELSIPYVSNMRVIKAYKPVYD